MNHSSTSLPSQVMEVIREKLMSKLDQLISQALQSASTRAGAQLQIEAIIVGHKSGEEAWSEHQRHLLQTISLDELEPSTLRFTRPVTAEKSDLRVFNPQPPSFPEQPLSHRSNLALLESPAVEDGDKDTEEDEDDSAQQTSRRKMFGGLRLGPACNVTPPRTPTPPSARQLESDKRNYPKRRKLDGDGPAKLQQSTVDKLIEGIWQQIHEPRTLSLGPEVGEVLQTIAARLHNGANGTGASTDFGNASRCCRQIACGSRTARALEVIAQAHWVDCYDVRLAALAEERPDLRPQAHKKMILAEACTIFSWSEKELRNRMAVWRGYREIKDAAGWSALVFAGHGIYRFCKYRLGFDHEAVAKLRSIRVRAEVAADTLQPQWRQLLSIVGAPTEVHWRGHPHDWVVDKDKDPLPLAASYRKWDPNFTFEHLEESIIDEGKWDSCDPRSFGDGPPFFCMSCFKVQSMVAESNECECFPSLFSPNPRLPCPVQVFQTDNGRNNGLIACCSFERGVAIGEFVGMITKDLTNVDVMHSQAGSNQPYQIWQGRSGNFTRFINHSCQPNCQFQPFSWLGVQRIVVVSKGVAAGKELTVDYSGRYWQHLDKLCLCGEARCRYKDRREQRPRAAA